MSACKVCANLRGFATKISLAFSSSHALEARELARLARLLSGCDEGPTGEERAPASVGAPAAAAARSSVHWRVLMVDDQCCMIGAQGHERPQ